MDEEIQIRIIADYINHVISHYSRTTKVPLCYKSQS